MTDDDTYPSEWLDEAPPPAWDRDTPRTAALDARLQEMCLMHTAADPRWIPTVLALAADLVAHEQVVEMLSAVSCFVTGLATGCHGYEVAIARFTGDLQQLRRIAIEEAEE